jgi:hypothetical protein
LVLRYKGPSCNGQSGKNGTAPPQPTQTPPHSSDAEAAVLSTLLSRPDLLPELAKTLQPEDFYEYRHQAIYAVLIALSRQGKPIDAVTLGEELLIRKAVEDVGGWPYLGELTDGVSTPNGLDYHAGTVRELARRRRLLNRLRELAGLAARPDGTVDGLLIEAGRLAADLSGKDANPGAAPAHTWGRIALDASLDAAESRPEILGLFYPDKTHIVFGEPESLKTWLALAAAAEVARSGGKVVWIDFEMTPGQVRRRLTCLGCSEEAVASSVIYLRPSEALRADSRAYLEGLLREHQPRLVVVDAFSGALGVSMLDDNSNQDVERWWQEVGLLLGGNGMRCLIVIDHVNKHEQNRGRYPSGSKRKLEGVEVGLQVELVETMGRQPPRNGRAKVHVTKDRPGMLPRPVGGELTLTVDLDGRITPAFVQAADDQPDKRFRPTCLMERVSRAVEAHPGISRTGVEGAVKGKARIIRQAIDLLITEGHIRVTGGPRDAQLLTSQRPFRDDPQAPATATPSHPVPPRPDSVPDGVATTPSHPPLPLREGGGHGTGSVGGKKGATPSRDRPDEDDRRDWIGENPF